MSNLPKVRLSGLYKIFGPRDKAMMEHVRAGMGKPELLDELIPQYLSQVEWLESVAGKYKRLYLVGGSFRGIAKSYMRRIGYPINFLHNYTLTAEEITPYLQEIAAYDEAQCSTLPVSLKRQPQLPIAARILLQLIQQTNAKKVVFSTSGIREGLLFSMLSPYLRQDDLLLSSCDMLRNTFKGRARYTRELFEWMTPLFDEQETHSMRRVRMAACMLNHLAMNIQRSNRAEWAYHHVLHASIRGLEHQERVALAAALYHRYRPNMSDEFGSYSLLDDKWKSWAMLVGATMRMGYMLSGGSPGNLGKTQLRLDDDRPKLRLSSSMKPLQGETLDKRKETLSHAYINHLRCYL